MIPGTLTLTESRAHLAASLSKMVDRCACGYHVATQGCHCDGSEWAIFTAALRSAVRDDLTIHQADVRPKIRGRVAPKQIGSFYRRAKSDGLIVDTLDREPSNDAAGRNLDKLDRIYRWTGSASVVAA